MAVESYLKENIDDNVTIKPWKYKNKLPIFLRNIYSFYDMRILDINCTLVEILDESPSIDVIEKHIKRIKEITNHEIVLYYKETTRYRRKSLIKNCIPFIIEDGQMFLPFLGLDLKKAPEYIDKVVSSFSTSTQLAFLYFLYNKDSVVNTTELAEKLRFTTMTASRALNDLYDAKLVTYKVGGKTGRSKEYQRIPDPEYFKKGHVYLKTPVRQVVYVENVPENALISGLEALAILSMINPPQHSIRGISSRWLKDKDIKIIKNKDIIKDKKLVELEIWDYDPKLFTNKLHVDIMSLYASLKEEKDARIEQALEYVLRGETWYTD